MAKTTGWRTAPDPSNPAPNAAVMFRRNIRADACESCNKPRALLPCRPETTRYMVPRGAPPVSIHQIKPINLVDRRQRNSANHCNQVDGLRHRALIFPAPGDSPGYAPATPLEVNTFQRAGDCRHTRPRRCGLTPPCAPAAVESHSAGLGNLPRRLLPRWNLRLQEAPAHQSGRPARSALLDAVACQIRGHRHKAQPRHRRQGRGPAPGIISPGGSSGLSGCACLSAVAKARRRARSQASVPWCAGKDAGVGRSGDLQPVGASSQRNGPAQRCGRCDDCVTTVPAGPVRS